MVANIKRKGRAAFLATVPLPDYRDVYFFEWSHSCDSYGVPDGSKEGVCFVPADLAAVSIVREYFENKSERLGLGDVQSFELTLICDELISNGIIATYEKGCSEHIVLRYKISSGYAIISVMDYGGGFNLPQVQQELPEGETLSDFLESLKRYRSQVSSKVPVGGQIVEYNRFGRGLRIVTGLADAIMILFHNKEGKLTHNMDEGTLGTVISVRYNLKNRKT